MKTLPVFIFVIFGVYYSSGDASTLKLKTNHVYHWHRAILTVNLSNKTQSPEFHTRGKVTVFLGNCACPKWPIRVKKCTGECAKKVSIKKSHLRNGDALEWKSKIVEEFDTDESAEDATSPNQLSVFLTAHKDGPDRTNYVFVENAILRVQKFKQDFETDEAPIPTDEETRIYEYPDAKGNPILRSGSGFVLELVADPTTTNPTTTEEITTTMEEVTTTSQETNPTEVNADTTPEPETPTTEAPSEEVTTDVATDAPSVETTTLSEDEPEVTTPSEDATTLSFSTDAETEEASDVTTTCKDV